MSQLFGDLLARFGGRWTPVEIEAPTEIELSRARAQGALRRDRAPRRYVLRKFHFFDNRGILHRSSPKRDRSISARQWKKQNKAAKRLAKAGAR